MSLSLANDIFLGLFHLWLCGACVVFLGLALWDAWHCVTDPHDYGDNDA